MNDYISREAAIDKMRSLKSSFRAKNDWDSGYDTAIAEAFEHIKRVPVADVQPVKRGNWVQIGEQSAKCTECGGVLKSNGIDKTGKALIFNAVYHYCPFCGARMDGDSE